MTELIWTEQFTESALATVPHSSWAYVNPPDILHLVNQINNRGGLITEEELHGLRLGAVQDLVSMMEYLGFIRSTDHKTYELVQEQSKPGFYSGNQLSAVLRDTGIEGPLALGIVGNNFLLYAREALPFACLLMPPGIPEAYLKQELMNRYVFNQKMNSFKFDILTKVLKQFKIIKDGDSGLVVRRAPPALTFYRTFSSYLFLASYIVGEKVNAGDLYREVDCLLPNRDEDYSVLGFKYFPAEGWRKHQAWITPDAFAQSLRIGLVDPLNIALVLKAISRDKGNPSRSEAKIAAGKMKEAIQRDAKRFKKEDPVDLADVLKELEWPDDTDSSMA